MSTIIAFTGAHGTGKTTAVYEHALGMKKIGAYEFGLITEVARRCPFPVLGPGTIPSPEAQMWMFTEQIKCEIESTLYYNMTISDRTVIDPIAYSLLFGYTALADAQLSLAREHVQIYETICFIRISNLDRLKPDGFRSTDRPLQIKVQKILLDLYKQLNVPITEVTHEYPGI